MNPPLIIKGSPLDFELCKLLGEGYADLIVICANGEQVPFLGTPFDSPSARVSYEKIVTGLNDRGPKSQWRELFRNWRDQFVKHYKLPPETTSFDFHPEFSFAISRVCAGYTEHLHAAVGLFGQLGDKVKSWGVYRGENGVGVVELLGASGRIYSERGEGIPRLIATVVSRLLIDLKT